ncbi:MAG: hypothetical protein QM680_03785 [Luteolibacter sp.]
MQNYGKLIGALAAASALVAGNAQAVEVNYDLHVGYSSDYLFRGLNLGSDLYEGGVDVSSEVGGLNLSAGAWYGSYELSNGAAGQSNVIGLGDDTLQANELDLYAQVAKDFGFVTAAVGYIYYDQQGAVLKTYVGDAQEVYFSLSRDFGFAAASLTYYWDIDGQVNKGDNDGYTALAVTKGFELNQCLTLNVGGTLGYLAEEGHLSHLTGKVSLDYAFAEHAKISPYVAASLDLSGGHGNASQYYVNTDAQKNELVGGVILSSSF